MTHRSPQLPHRTAATVASRFRPLLAATGSVLGVLLLIGARSATSDQTAVTGSTVALTASAQGEATGPVVNTRYGPVQVRATVKAGRVTDVQAVQLPVGGQSGDIADYSAPILRRAALAAQGAGIHAVSGATYTSEGYATSLQAALDQLAAETTSSSSLSSATP